MEKPILFSTDMVQALLDGRKTQTRRMLKIRACKHFIPHSYWHLEEIKKWNKDYHPYGKPGDLLWVRETFCPTGSDEYLNKSTAKPFFYIADVKNPEFVNKLMPEYGWKWKPSIHMPKVAARIWLKVTNVRVERLKDISKSDALAEGVFEIEKDEAYKDYMEQAGSYAGPIGSFFSLWESINGLDSLIADPWVWVIEFEVVSTTGRNDVKEVQL